MTRVYRSTFLLLITALTFASTAAGQTIEPRADGTPVVLTLDEAVQIALVQNHVLRSTALDLETADAQIREAWGQLLPQVDVSSSYTRNVVTANPFAGSEAGGLFASFGFVDWLAYNEQARMDDDPSTEPLPLDEFMDRRRQGMAEIGAAMGDSGNPFGVENQFVSGIQINQTLFNGSAFAAIRGARQLREINQRALDREQQLLVDRVRQAFYQSLLSDEQARVSRQSVERMRETLREVSRQVEQGVAPVFQRLSAEVEVANLETQHMQAANAAALAVDNLKMELGIPIEMPLELRGELMAPDLHRYADIPTEAAVEEAIERRPDLEQARLAIELNRVDRSITRGQFLPTVSAFANLDYIGSVPSDRTSVTADPDDPFRFTSSSRGFFDGGYWNPAVSVGVSLQWNIFNGFQTSAQVQQREVAIRRAEIDYERAYQAVYLEVQAAQRDLETARQRIQGQEVNVERAELNYDHALARLREGVATPLEAREASLQLDTSRINYLQAVHDYLVARSAFETAIGVPAGAPADLPFSSN